MHVRWRAALSLTALLRHSASSTHRRHFHLALYFNCFSKEIIYAYWCFYFQQHGAAGIARRAHNPEVPRSKRGAANVAELEWYFCSLAGRKLKTYWQRTNTMRDFYLVLFSPSAETNPNKASAHSEFVKTREAFILRNTSTGTRFCKGRG